jgi:DNA repair exonuclease SbcCD ATPase subunit
MKMVLSLKEDSKDAEKIKSSLDEVVDKLEQDSKSSDSWGESVSTHRSHWDEIKEKIRERQSELKRLVMEKKAGTIGQGEFEKKYRKLQDELTELEFQVYNMRLGTSVDF